MIKKILKKKIEDFIKNVNIKSNEAVLLTLGGMLAKQLLLINSNNINDYEFKIFSQFGDDGIIQHLIRNIKIQNEVFIEFGVWDYSESNTRFLMMNNNWSGFVMDGSKEAMEEIKQQDWYWKYDLIQKAVFIDKDNINDLLAETGFENIGLLHIDLDGNDYHIFNQIDLSKLNPSILIFEYNSVFGNERAITVPYNKAFDRTKAHFSNLYFGASLPAFDYLASKRGYSLVGCNLAGNNAYFVRKDLMNNNVKELSVAEAFKVSKFREGRKMDYSFSYNNYKERIEHIKGLPVVNVLTDENEVL